MLLDRITEEGIAALVDAFYAEVRRDPQIGPVFERAIPADKWPAHLEKMHAFWSTIMLNSGRYRGNPLLKHAAVRGIKEPMFARWLALFQKTATDLFTESLARQFAERSNQIAKGLKLGLYHRPPVAGPAIRPQTVATVNAATQEDPAAATST